MKNRKDYTLEDIDGSQGPGRAALVMIDLDDPYGEHGHRSLMRADVEEEPGRDNPIRHCWALWEGTKADWPGHSAVVVGNPRAEYLDWKHKMDAMGLESTPAFYLECASNPLMGSRKVL